MKSSDSIREEPNMLLVAGFHSTKKTIGKTSQNKLTGITNS